MFLKTSKSTTKYLNIFFKQIVFNSFCQLSLVLAETLLLLLLLKSWLSMKMFQWSHEDERLCPQTWPDRSSSRVNKSNCRRGVLAAEELAVDEDVPMVALG
jgi:hypothetical protein